MIRFDEQALICDLAETYRIYDYKSLPATLVATYSVGLRDNSRIKMKASGEEIARDIFLQAVIADRLGLICYALSGGKNDKPVSIVDILLGDVKVESKNSKVKAFSSPEEFWKAWKGED